MIDIEDNDINGDGGFKKTMIAMVTLTRLTPLKDHRAVWKMQQRGSLGETLLHILIFGNRSQLERAHASFGFSIQ